MNKIRKLLCEIAPEAMLADGFDNAIIGTTERDGVTIVVYDQEKLISMIKKSSKMSWDDALEYFEFNILGAYVGTGTPIFISLIWKGNK